MNLKGRPAISYARFSSLGQVDNDSLRRQRETFDCEIKKTGAIPTDIELVDQAKSGYKGDHIKSGSLGSFIEQLEVQVFTARPILFIEKWDRLGRQKNSITQGVLQTLLKYIDVYDCSDGQLITQDTENDLGASITLLVKIHAAWQYSKNLSDRIRASKKEQFKEAQRENKLVLHGGYPRWLKVENGVAELIPERAGSIKLIFKLLIAGSTLGAISRHLNEIRAPHWKGDGSSTVGTWTSGRLSSLTRQPALMGVHRSRTWKDDGTRFESYSGWNEGGTEVEGAYPAVVSKEDWDLVQKIRESNKTNNKFNRGGNRTSTRGDGRNIFPEVKCAMCGANFRYKATQKEMKYHEFVCGTKKNAGACGSSSINYQLAEKMLLNRKRSMN